MLKTLFISSFLLEMIIKINIKFFIRKKKKEKRKKEKINNFSLYYKNIENYL